MGAPPMRAGERPADWLAKDLGDVGARRVRHPGKHRYAFRLGPTRRDRTAVQIAPRPRSYPKAGQGQLGLFAAGPAA